MAKSLVKGNLALWEDISHYGVSEMNGFLNKMVRNSLDGHTSWNNLYLSFKW